MDATSASTILGVRLAQNRREADSLVAWHERHGHAREAIRHALRGGDVDAAVRVLWSEAPGPIARAENDEVRLWLAEFSPEQIAARAPLALVAAASALAAGDGEQLERWTAAAARRLDGRWSGTRAMRDAPPVLRAAGGPEGVARMGEEAARARRSVRESGLWPAIARLLEGVADHLSGRLGGARAPLAEGGHGGATAAPGIQALCLASSCSSRLTTETGTRRRCWPPEPARS